MKTIRQSLSALIVEVNLISPELADQHVQEMTDGEVLRRLEVFFKVSGPVFHEAEGAIGNLTIHGMGDRAGKISPMPAVESFLGSGAKPQNCEAEQRLAWAREMVRRAREGWPVDGQGFLPLKGG